jgi:ABC transport system ATP-binding/permease protein
VTGSWSGPLRVRIGTVDRVVDGVRPVTIGRDPKCDVPLDDPEVSRLHCRLCLDPIEGWVFEEAGSSNGSFVTGAPVHRRVIDRPVVVRLGHPDRGEELRLEPADDRVNHPPPPPPPRPPAPSGHEDADYGELHSSRRLDDLVRIGRSPDNQIVIDDLGVSRLHAELRRTAAGVVTIIDRDSHNGTFVNGRQVSRQQLDEGDVVGIGRHSFRLRGGELDEYVDSGEIRFEASGLTFRTPSGQTILDDVSFAMEPSSLLAVMGPAGVGKSTLMKALVGSQPATQGAVYYGGLDLYRNYQQLRSRIGYVPQDDILHPQLRCGRRCAMPPTCAFPPTARPPTAAGGWRRSWANSAWPTGPTSRSPSCRAASASAPTWPRSCSPSRPCSCSTSPQPASTPD